MLTLTTLRSHRPVEFLLKLSPWLAGLIFLGPLISGLIGTWLPAFGWLPVIGADQFSLQPLLAFWQTPGIQHSLITTLLTGFGATLAALFLLLLMFIGAYPSRLFSALERILAPLLSIPHAAFAIGLGFLLVPSGTLARSLHLLTGQFAQTPQWLSYQDPWGLSLLLAMTLKELPFLLLMSLAVLPELKVTDTLRLSRSLGHRDSFTWCWLIFPQLYRALKLPVFAVLAYSLTVVDMALIAGPTTPPTLAVRITWLFNDPDLSLRLAAAAGATSLLLLVLSALTVLHLAERPLRLLRTWALAHAPVHRRQSRWPSLGARLSIVLMTLIYSATLAVTVLWSLSQRWRYPDLLPQSYSLAAWSRIGNRLFEPLITSLSLASLSAVIATVLTVLALENEVRLKYQRGHVNRGRIMMLVYLPLLIPQVAFLFGFQVSLIYLRLDSHYLALLWAHLVFVLPYVFLTLSGAYRRFDDRYSWLAVSLSGSRVRSFWQIKLPILLRPVLYAWATGFSVSIAQYLPTLFVGGGQFTTLTTEAVAMASGSDRRLIAVMALWQQLLPFVVFLLATAIPAYLFRHRPAMRQSAS